MKIIPSIVSTDHSFEIERLGSTGDCAVNTTMYYIGSRYRGKWVTGCYTSVRRDANTGAMLIGQADILAHALRGMAVEDATRVALAVASMR